MFLNGLIFDNIIFKAKSIPLACCSSRAAVARSSHKKKEVTELNLCTEILREQVSAGRVISFRDIEPPSGIEYTIDQCFGGIAM